MARHKRILDAGLVRHVMARGNARMPVFLDDTDYRKFVYILSDVVEDYDLDCWAACLMPNHYHLALLNRKPNLPRAMQQLNGEYATWWNERHRRVGHVFQGRYKDQIVQHEGYLRNLVSYILRNPLRAGLANGLDDWPWSSYRDTAGQSPNFGFIVSEPVLAQFGEGSLDALRGRFVEHMHAAVSDEEAFYKRLRSRQRVLGDPSFRREFRQSEDVLPDKRHAGAGALAVRGLG